MRKVMRHQQYVALIDRLSMSEDTLAEDSTTKMNVEESIRQNLETLLNTRAYIPLSANKLTLAKSSCLFYGMIDFMNIDYTTEYGKMTLRDKIQLIVEQYESRLNNVSIVILDDEEDTYIFGIQINATISVNSTTQHTSFESMLSKQTHSFCVTKGY